MYLGLALFALKQFLKKICNFYMQKRPQGDGGGTTTNLKVTSLHFWKFIYRRTLPWIESPLSVYLSGTQPRFESTPFGIFVSQKKSEFYKSSWRLILSQNSTLVGVHILKYIYSGFSRSVTRLSIFIKKPLVIFKIPLTATLISFSWENPSSALFGLPKIR